MVPPLTCIRKVNCLESLTHSLHRTPGSSMAIALSSHSHSCLPTKCNNLQIHNVRRHFTLPSNLWPQSDVAVWKRVLPSMLGLVPILYFRRFLLPTANLYEEKKWKKWAAAYQTDLLTEWSVRSKLLSLFSADSNRLHNAGAVDNKNPSFRWLRPASGQEECACYPDDGTIHLINARHMSNSQ